MEKGTQVTITDITKLAPELLSKSRAQIEREIAERQMALAEMERRERIKDAEETVLAANKHIDSIIEGVKWLHDKGLLPERVATGFSRADGIFTPTVALRSITAESLVPALKVPRTPRPPRPRDPNAPKRKRRTRAQMDAAQV